MFWYKMHLMRITCKDIHNWLSTYLKSENIYIRQWTWLSLVRVIAWCQTGPEPLSTSMLIYCQSIGPIGTNFAEVSIKRGWAWFNNLHLEMYNDNDVIMGTIASQITSLTSVYSTVYSGTDERKHQSSASLAFMNSAVTGEFPTQMTSYAEMFPFDDVIMQCRPFRAGSTW